MAEKKLTNKEVEEIKNTYDNLKPDDTIAYKEGDAYEHKYTDAPAKEKQYKVGQQLTIRSKDNVLLALWEVEETNENRAKGKIVKVFLTKVPMDPRRVEPAPSQRKKPL